MKKLLILSVLFLFPVILFAEDLTITTYYPSPAGVYNELQTNKLSVGDTDGSGSLNSSDLPPANGQIYAARGVIFKPQSSLPSSGVTKGELVYNNSDNKFYYYDGTSWQAQAGSGGSICVVTYNSPVGNCVCPTGWTLKLNLGSWGHCSNIATFSSFNFYVPPGGNCPYPWSRFNLGQGCLCCQ